MTEIEAFRAEMTETISAYITRRAAELHEHGIAAPYSEMVRADLLEVVDRVVAATARHPDGAARIRQLRGLMASPDTLDELIDGLYDLAYSVTLH